jgi:hypothetical protein
MVSWEGHDGTMRHNGTMARWPKAQWHRGMMVRWYHGTKVQGQRHGGNIVGRHDGQWHNGTLYDKAQWPTAQCHEGQSQRHDGMNEGMMADSDGMLVRWLKVRRHTGLRHNGTLVHNAMADRMGWPMAQHHRGTV